VITLGQEHLKAHVAEEAASVAVNTELQRDDQGNYFFFEEDREFEEDDILMRNEPRVQGRVGATSMYGVRNVNIAASLLHYPQDGDAEEVQDFTPLPWAASNGNDAVVQVRLEKGAELDSKDDCGGTSLSMAAANGNEVVVRLLLEKGAELDSRDESGWTPLLWAAANGHEAVARLLLEKGAEPGSKDKCGGTPLLWAIERGHVAIVSRYIPVEGLVAGLPLICIRRSTRV
jgi:ankyrin repeat protein